MTELSAAVSLRFKAGKDVALEFTVTDENDDVVNIAGMTIRFAVARRVGDTAVLSTEADPATATATATDAANGVFEVEADATDTAGLSGTYRFEAEIEDGAGDKNPVAWGFITFEPSVIT